jgi:hypothetical protein
MYMHAEARRVPTGSLICFSCLGKSDQGRSRYADLYNMANLSCGNYASGDIAPCCEFCSVLHDQSNDKAPILESPASLSHL